jgi:fatty-acid desaturase
MILSIAFFINIFQQSTIVNLLEYPGFWLVSGLLLYFAGTFFMNIVGQVVLYEKVLGFDVYDIHSFLNIFLNIIYTIALWMSSRRLISAQ